MSSACNKIGKTETGIQSFPDLPFPADQRTDMREVMIARLAPVSPQLILCFIAEKVLGLPKSY